MLPLTVHRNACNPSIFQLMVYKCVCVGGGDRGEVGEGYDSIKLRKLKLRIIDTIVNV